MKEFWMRYKGDFFKLITTRIALDVFSLLCISPLMVMDANKKGGTIHLICILATIFVFGFYYYLIHTQLWIVGAKNKISADGGRMVLRPMTGLYLGLMASIPSFILNIANSITFFFKDYAVAREIHVWTALLETLWDAPAVGLFYVLGNPFVYFAASVLPALFAGLSYYLGTKEFKLFGRK